MPLIYWALGTLVSAFIGSYLASYLKQKGKNFATHEDIDRVVEQVRAVTSATKEIEAKISGELWDKQKQWEMRREVLFSAAKQVGGLVDFLMDYRISTEKYIKSPNSYDFARAKLDCEQHSYHPYQVRGDGCFGRGDMQD